MATQEYPEEFLERLRAVTKTRPRRVIDHILEHGQITTEELTNIYGYAHPPRAARDVREEGIPLITFNVTNAEGKTIAAYRFANPSEFRPGREGGRRNFPLAFKQRLLDQFGSQCKICSQYLEGRYLQIDHRVPFEVSGEPDELETEEYMLLCASCNRAKSWSCEHCPNWIEDKQQSVCQSCYWGNPDSHTHVALMQIRRLDISWAGDETSQHDRLRARARRSNQSISDYLKALLSRHLKADGE